MEWYGRHAAGRNQPANRPQNQCYLLQLSNSTKTPTASWDVEIKARASALVIYHSPWCYLNFSDWKSVYMPSSCYFCPPRYTRYMGPTLVIGFTVKRTRATRLQVFRLSIGKIWGQTSLWCESRIREDLYVLSGLDQKTTVSKSCQLRL